ncbi:5-pentadecatrienyl resorcinol O-methyltransferase-like [Panicum miliaceum]|uniref:5-pentadecatrienyl resorcinol O-methyltransferase-like n=1 Tax=Panicum miliaceum TaxID=4540 RepID=A0A3L6QTE3_PANMI|nr:5-pentadecatrienyl resorcinol O-methyltransferase-like [Panicum miliaceum]
MAIRGSAKVFDEIASLVDVATGTGAAAQAVAAVFPSIKCMVLDLPQVIDALAPVNGP